MKVIGLTGYAGAGKDYVCDLLVEDYDAVRVAFADGVRLEIEDVLSPGTFSSHDHKLPAVWAKPYSPEVRKLLQWWGTEYRRAENEDYWVDKGVGRIQRAGARFNLIVVTDVRFVNEAKAIQGLGGIVLEVAADQAIRARRLGGSLPPAHASEVIDFETDGIIRNDDETKAPALLWEYLDDVRPAVV